MDKLFESPVFVKLQAFGEKIGSNKAVNAIQGALMGSMGIIMVGAIFQLTAVIGANLGLLETGSDLYNTLYGVYNLTMNMLSFWFVIQLGYNYAKALKLKPMSGAINATLGFLIVSTVGYRAVTMESLTTGFLGGTGLFIAILVGLVSIRIYNLCVTKNIVIKMPEVVPPFLADSFSAIVPLFFTVILWLVVSVGTISLTGATFPEVFIGLISKPLSALTGFWGMLALGVIAGMLWALGIHGTMMVYVAIMPVMLDVVAKNAAAYQAGGVDALTYSPVLLMGLMACAGGTGNTIGAALWGLKAKSEQIRAVAKVGVVPGIFNINEPITFGYPVMYNPIMAIPFTLNIVIAMVIGHISYGLGISIPAYISVGSVMPIGVAEFLGTLNIGNVLTTLVIVVVTTLVWYPFMKAYDKQLYAKEQEEMGQNV